VVLKAVPKPVERIWGGLRGEDGPVGELWWLYDDETGSTALESPGGGEAVSLRSLSGRRFPVLVKTLHTSMLLSVQVHPGAGGGAGKAETWAVLRASPDAFAYAGLAPGEDPEGLLRAIGRGDPGPSLARLPLAAGDVLHLPPGTVHALGPGLTVLEVQENNDITYRMYDWGRTGPDGRPRKLHLDEAMGAISGGSRPFPRRPGRGAVRGPGYDLRPAEPGELDLPPWSAVFLPEGGGGTGELLLLPGGGRLRAPVPCWVIGMEV
jgi:mannose-6-phosphate isomerase